MKSLVGAALAGAVTIVSAGIAAAQPAADALPGANNWSCAPSAAHPVPVVLVHGTNAGSVATWKTVAPALAAEGYCVFALDYGRMPPGSVDLLNMLGTADIAASARELSAFVEKVRAATGAAQVDLVGHSQGGVVARQYLRFEGGADPADPGANKVRKVVMLGATNHGSTFGDVQYLGAVAEKFGIPVVSLLNSILGPSYVQQMVGSPFLRALNEGGDTEPGVDYTVVASRDDKISSPPENTFLTAGSGATVHNTWVQDVCSSAVVDHMQLTTDPVAVHIVKSALDPVYAANVPAPC
ncbi:triacylglycerol lipase [Prescottella sp. R16]|uniref:esterase/lipase family protein n=1 Tax=Prescottella sp. R16 TaxID=3064529 RepID=UPI00272EBB03|nr:alpha/beta fold hydrolase [Prescottella sp. R16]